MKELYPLKEIIRIGLDVATVYKSEYIRPIHLFMGIIKHERNSSCELLLNLGLDLDSITTLLEELLTIDTENRELRMVIPFTTDAQSILDHVNDERKLLKDNKINSHHLMLSILAQKSSGVSRFLLKFGVEYKTYKKELISMSMMYNEEPFGQEEGTPSGKTPTEKSGTPILDAFSLDVTEEARNGKLDTVIGREKEVDRIAQILSRRKKNNPVLIGDPGVGKSSIVDGLATKIITKKCPRPLMGKRVVSLDLTSLVAGTKYRGQFEERIKGLLDEVRGDKDIIMFIDELHTMVGAGNSSGSMDAANILKPALSRGQIQCIGATTLDEYREHIEKDGALERRFQKVMIDPPTKKETLTILNNIKETYEDYHKVSYTKEAIIKCVELSERYITDRNFPDKAIDVLDEAGASVAVHAQPPKRIEEVEKQIDQIKEEKNKVVISQQYEKAASLRDKEKTLKTDLKNFVEHWETQLQKDRSIVDEEQILKVISTSTNIPVTKLSEDESQKLLDIDKVLKSSIIGQDLAIDKVCKSLRRNRVGIKNPNKPIGSFMFLGPTGVGKTELANQLALEVFGSEDSLIRVDMSEYAEKFAATKMIGSPPGYVGYNEGGQLTEKVRRKPYSLVLFDEVEKAHPDIFHSLLQLLDDGYMTDGMGRKVNFRNCLVVLTSNIGMREVDDFGEGVGFRTSNSDDYYEERVQSIIDKNLKKRFNPEFINRLDDIVVFNKLSKDDISKILEVHLGFLKERMLEMGYTIKVNKSAKDLVMKKGYSDKYGARPMNRAISNYLEDAIAEEMLRSSVKKGSTLSLSYDKKTNKIKVKVS
jgi:ATP-dependent Clp protease ATP-binding subunit ClpC